jgi:hypothetical protein
MGPPKNLGPVPLHTLHSRSLGPAASDSEIIVLLVTPMDVPVSDSPSAAKTAGILAGIARRRRPRYKHGPQNGVTTDTAVDSN